MKVFVAKRLRAIDLASSAILLSGLMLGLSHGHRGLVFYLLCGLIAASGLFRLWLLWTFRVSAAKDPEILELLRDA